MQIERKLLMPKGRALRILQVSDPQDMHFVRHTMIRMLNKAYDTLKPDIVVFTGDNVLGNHLNENRFDKVNNEKAYVKKHMETAIDYIAKPLVKRHIPFCMVYGNHDDMNMLTKQEQADIYKKYPYFFGLNDEDETVDCDTYNAVIYNSTGEKPVFNLWFMDSAGKDDGTGKGFSYVKPQAISWYQAKSDLLKKQNGGQPLPSLMFQHIPIEQTRQLFCECDANDKNAVKWCAKNGKSYKLDAKKAVGYAYEYPEVCEKDFGELEAIKKQGDVCALVFGHDHANSFIGEIDGVKIIQCPAASFRCYGTRQSRGVMLYEIDENNPQNIKTTEYNYFTLMGNNPISQFDYFLGADEYDDSRPVILSLVGGIIAAGTVAALLAEKIRIKAE